eukprot:1908821-Prymnesium_polylepis.2
MVSRRGSKPATERPSHRLTVPGRRTATLSPPCSSAIVRYGSPIRALRTPSNGAGQAVECNRQAATERR